MFLVALGPLRILKISYTVISMPMTILPCAIVTPDHTLWLSMVNMAVLDVGEYIKCGYREKATGDRLYDLVTLGLILIKSYMHREILSAYLWVVRLNSNVSYRSVLTLEINA